MFFENGKWNMKIYYTNFEISKLSFWRSHEYMNFFDYLDGLGGIYKYRWGDAPIHTLALSIFLPDTKIHCFKDISYKHFFLYPGGSSTPLKFIRYDLPRLILIKLYSISHFLKTKFKWYKRLVELVKNE